MTVDNPLVSIYMPTHNRVDLLEKAVNSVISQTYKNWELIIVNDCSSDNTEVYLKAVSKKDSRINFYTNDTSKGACFSRNLALRESIGYYITGLDDDDVFTSDRIKVLLESYKPKYAFVSSDWRVFPSSFISQLKRHIVYKRGVISLDDLLDKNHIGNQVFTERSKMLDVGGFDESLPAWQDYDLWVRLVQRFGAALKVGNITQVILVDNTIKRITNSIKRVDGIKMFMAKHQNLISDKQRIRIEKLISKLS